MGVPKGGLEPPQAYAYMTLNHARLPIPPLRLAVSGVYGGRRAEGKPKPRFVFPCHPPPAPVP